jgi:P-type conjugative transfer ATPase TrbB
MADARTQLVEGLTYNLGPTITEALNDPDVVEVMVNPDGNIWVEKLGEEMKIAGTLGFYQAKDVVILMASSMDFEANVENPVVQGELPLDGSRFHGVLPPNVSPQASFTIRKKASKVFSLEQYVEQGIVSASLYEVLRASIAGRKNILVVGGTGSGKTTFLNALIKTMSELCSEHRVLILEDTMELQCESANKVFMRTSDFLKMGGLVMTCLRYRPDRILIGEVRDEAALDLLKAWNTGHPGGFATVHANSAEEGLDRLEELTEEAGKGPKQKLIGRAVDMILFIQKTGQGGRKITEAITVHGYDPVSQTYKTEDIYNAH